MWGSMGLLAWLVCKGNAALLSPPLWSVPPDGSDSELELSTVRHQPEGLDQLQAQTKFTKKELQSLYRGFKNVSVAETGAIAFAFLRVPRAFSESRTDPGL